MVLLFTFQVPEKQLSMNVQSNLSFDLQGHRGCRGLIPENTIPAMIRALELGVQTLEMDVVVTSDKQVILSHEPFFNHEIATKPDGTPISQAEERALNIFKMTYAEVLKFDVGMATHPRFPEQKKIQAVKPRLSDVIIAVKEWCATHKKPLPFFNIETKCMPATDNEFHPEPDEFVELLVKVLQKHELIEKTIIQSFDFRTLKYAHATYPEIALAALIEADDKYNLNKHLEKLGFVPDIYSPAYERVNEDMVGKCHYLGMRLVPWTVNDETTAANLKMLGVDGIITDYPDRVR
jgi:glycerophosphoryl diester phosphodiesterase